MKKLKLGNLCAALAVTAGTFFFANTASASMYTIAFSNAGGGMSFMTAKHAYGIAEPYWYNEWVSNAGGWFLIDEFGGLQAGHYHFWADDPTVNCFTTTPTWPAGVMGRQPGGTCTAVNPLTTSRDVHSHNSGYWIRIKKNNSSPINWRAAQLYVKGNQPARVVVEHTDGTWWYYVNLTQGWIWNLGVNGHKAKTVYVMNENASAGEGITFDNFVIEAPI